jgi:hypothetical protein
VRTGELADAAESGGAMVGSEEAAKHARKNKRYNFAQVAACRMLGMADLLLPSQEPALVEIRVLGKGDTGEVSIAQLRA